MAKQHYTWVCNLSDLELAQAMGFDTEDQGAMVRAKCHKMGWENTSHIPAGVNWESGIYARIPEPAPIEERTLGAA